MAKKGVEARRKLVRMMESLLLGSGEHPSGEITFHTSKGSGITRVSFSLSQPDRVNMEVPVDKAVEALELAGVDAVPSEAAPEKKQNRA